MKLIDKIELIPLDQIIPYHNNPKEHPPEQVKKIASSIKEFGFLVPVIVDSDYDLIAGHGRYEAAKLIGMDKVPGLKAEHLTDAQVKAFRLADNRVAESEWNYEQLLTELDLVGNEFTGFDDDEIFEMEESLKEIPMSGDLEKLDKEENPPTMNVRFENPEDFRKMEDDLRKLIKDKYPDTNIFISSGEI